MTQNKSKITSSTSTHTDAGKSLIWENDTIPRSVQFDDTYYSKADGLRETQFVFIEGNRLTDRWPNMSTCTIGEMGFGTGLNFLVTAIEWQKTIASVDQQFNFISFEQYPLTAKEMHKALSRWPAISKEAATLVAFWSKIVEQSDLQPSQPITINFSKNITLKVYIGDANKQMALLNTKIDAWYLDGFSPAKNPELWNETLMQQVANNTKPQGTFATYTAAGFVRKNLSNVGFKVERTKGYAGKRHMSVGSLM